MLGYFLWSLAIIFALALSLVGGFVVCGWADDGDDSVARWVVAGLVVVVLVASWCAFVTWGTAEDGPGGSVRWRGGAGPRTECWYDTVDGPDVPVSTGKTMVIVDGGRDTYTVCSTSS